MPAFEYQALDPSGTRFTGVLAAASEQAVLAELEGRRLTPVKVLERPAAKRSGRGVPQKALANSYQQLADLLRAGVPLLRSLELLGRQKASKKLAGAYSEICDAVSDGQELSAAMTERPDVFPSVHVAMVQAGEKGGFLEQIFGELAGFVKGQAELKGKVVGSLIYPAVLVFVGGMVLSGVIGIFVPMFRDVFSSMDSLPAVTKFVFFLSDLITGFGPIVAGLLAVGVVALWRATKHAAVRRALAVARTKGPVIGPLVRALASARFCRMLGTMEANGVPLLTAMGIARNAAGNALLEEAIDTAIEAVRRGDSLAEPLGESDLLGEDVVEMIAVGEAAGNIDTVLLNVAGTLESRVEGFLSTVVKLIEPLLLLAIGAVIFVIAVALILPMTQMTSGM